VVPGYRFTQGSRFASNPGLQLANAFGVIDAISERPLALSMQLVTPLALSMQLVTPLALSMQLANAFGVIDAISDAFGVIDAISERLWRYRCN